MNLSRRKFLRRAAVAVPAAAIAVPLAIKAVEAHVENVETVADHGDTPFVASGQIEVNDRLIVSPQDEGRTCAFARVDDPTSILWCVKREDGKKLWVINGHWSYDPSDPQWPDSALIWEGVAPFEHSDYNEAINWIRDQVAA